MVDSEEQYGIIVNMKGADIVDEEKVYINPDGWYPQCNKCGYFDLEYLQEYCPQCGCKQDWSDIIRMGEME